MKKLIQLTFLIVFTAFFISENVLAQERGNDSNRASPNASISQTIGTTEVTVTYGRPALKDRGYFGDNTALAPIGSVWRTGANESTAITFSDDVMFGGEQVEAGTYSLYTIPGTDEWTIILNGKLSWGTQYDEAEDVVRVTAEPVEGSDLEWFEIYFNELSDTKAHLNLHWGTTRVPVPIETM
ncbi:MAG TPA: DUF2911 domain-containing protein [Gracilimonas sp.]|uniref:DUF2911 domain-containing protein n=1 Tax=Gracilimonas sp. TaxID=1974203 RepID=UPI002DAFA86B|nr:DUF2911 domain-containing protein [Gracilimonas sp.]